jgi:hypothetical protein
MGLRWPSAGIEFNFEWLSGVTCLHPGRVAEVVQVVVRVIAGREWCKRAKRA